ncbi:SET domain-containing protein [Salmonella enterica]|uniref:SET domain-containing protein n=1 Tax=Salmonella enterica TaxID=28901 RepID=A0A5Y9Q6Q0_SALER|nr:SET domain-containing protein-lysine N-methyltransferase [Salmonella enterica]EED8464536.1 SET domain-containing protein [Salmonella enterica subsp. diarizonae serovar 61:i:z53]EAV5842309.1 SET domain-containing protein [Salmonella enterica]EAX4509556.1 SET domain-containing protein [Salmonella enterica]EAY9084761.1 SET domain-containing protein [Salmonella enterica]
MRGIGAVTHLSSPTGSSAPSPDFSGMWNSIRDWFSLPVQDEAALCFHVFYQPDEGTSLPDRLKHFLRLKALASPGRQDNFTAERILGTGETICMIASGKSSDLPSVTLHLSDQEWHTAQPQEAVAPLAEATESPGRGPTGPPITRTQIQTWLDLPQEAKSDAGGWRKWAQAQGVTLGSAALYLTNTGLTPYGRERLHPPKERGRPITVGQIQTWRDLSEEARSAAGGWVTWAQAQGISITSARKHLTNMGLTFYGMERLQHPKERGAPITKAQLLTWFNMSQEEHNKAGGWITWAQTQGIATSSARSCLTNTGLTTRGMERLQLPEKRGLPITDRQIQAWKDLPQEKKHEAGGWTKWAQAQEISITSAKKYLTNTGLTPRGMELLRSSGDKVAPITESQLLTWLNMSAQEHSEAGGWITWAQAQGITTSSARKYLTNTGLTPRGMERLQHAEERGRAITDRQIQAWRDLPQETKLESGGWKAWAQTQGIPLSSAGNFLTNTGLTPFGIVRLLPPEERGTPITNAQIQAWRDLPQEAKKEAGGRIKWAQTQGIAIRSAENFLTNTGLTLFGIERLLPPEKRGTPITNAQILAWQELSQEAKNEAGGCIKWAQAQGITISSACSYLTNTGLTHHGRKRLQPPEERGSTISQAQLLEWFNMSQEERTKTGGWRRWAEARGITFRSAETFLTNSGLTLFGIERLKPPGERGAPITNAQIRTWRDMSQEAKREAGGWIKWALAQGIAIGSASGYLTNTGLKYNGIVRLQQSLSATVTSDSQQTSMSAGASDEITASVGILPERSGEKRSLPSTKEDISAPPAKQIKKEEDAVTWRTHQINNNLPILQHWRDPTISVMAQAEGRIETLQVTRWGPLFNPLPRQIKARINQDIRWFLQNEGSHDARMNAMMSVAIPLDDSDGYRGRTVYARTDLAAFTVLGPYSGRLLDSEKVRCEYEKEYGKEAGNYYFATRSQERIVSGFPQGNLLSLLNSPVFTHRTAEAEVRQNVSAVLVGKNINFFLTTRDVHAGDELWFDYGPDYQHFEPGETLRPTQVKEEPPSSEGE